MPAHWPRPCPDRARQTPRRSPARSASRARQGLVPAPCPAAASRHELEVLVITCPISPHPSHPPPAGPPAGAHPHSPVVSMILASIGRGRMPGTHCVPGRVEQTPAAAAGALRPRSWPAAQGLPCPEQSCLSVRSGLPQSPPAPGRSWCGRWLWRGPVGAPAGQGLPEQPAGCGRGAWQGKAGLGRMMHSNQRGGQGLSGGAGRAAGRICPEVEIGTRWNG
jgi:hypothetical protein